MTYLSQLDHSPVKSIAYYVQLRTYKEENLFGLDSESSRLNLMSQIVADEWSRTASYHPRIRLDQWVIVPSGLQALLMIKDAGLVSNSTALTRPSVKPWILSSFITAFKAAAAKRINLVRSQPGSPVWQRSYQEQRIDTEQTFIQLRQKLLSSPGAIWTVSMLVDQANAGLQSDP